jgi:uncharacterized protein YbaR (Trm112 family)
MIKVLEHGVRKVICPNCKAKLQYEQEDILTDERDYESIPGSWESQEIQYIICPDCRNEIILTCLKR